MCITALIRGSYLGRSLRAVRDDDEVAAASGIRVSVALLFAFATGARYASLAGSLYAHYIRVLDPSSFTIVVSAEVLLMCVIGGRDSLWGPVIGAVLITGLPEFFRPLAEYRLVIYGPIDRGADDFSAGRVIEPRPALYTPGPVEKGGAGAQRERPMTRRINHVHLTCRAKRLRRPRS